MSDETSNTPEKCTEIGKNIGGFESVFITGKNPQSEKECNQKCAVPTQYCCVQDTLENIAQCRQATVVECNALIDKGAFITTKSYDSEQACTAAAAAKECVPMEKKVYCNPNAKNGNPNANFCQLAATNPDPNTTYNMYWVDAKDPGALGTCENTCGRHYCVYQDGDSAGAQLDGIAYLEKLKAPAPNGLGDAAVTRINMFQGDLKALFPVPVLAYKITQKARVGDKPLEVIYAYDGADWLWGLETIAESWTYVGEGYWTPAEVAKEDAFKVFNKISEDLGKISNVSAAECIAYPKDHLAVYEDQLSNLCTKRNVAHPPPNWTMHTYPYTWDADGLTYDRLFAPFCPKEDPAAVNAKLGQPGFNLDVYLWGTIAVEGPLADKGFDNKALCDPACAGVVGGARGGNNQLNNPNPARPNAQEFPGGRVGTPPFRGPGPNPIQPYGPTPLPSSLPGRVSSVTGTSGPPPPRPSSAGGGIPTSSSPGGTPPSSRGGVNSSAAAPRSSSPAASSPGGFNQCSAGGSCTVRVAGNQCVQVPVDCRTGYTLQCSGTCGTDACKGQCCRCVAGTTSSAASANSSRRSANSSGRSANSSGASANSSGRSANSSGRSANSSGRSANSSGASANSSGRSANSSSRSSTSSGRSSFGFQSSYAFSSGSSYGFDSSDGFDSSYGTISSARTGQNSSLDEYCRLFPSRCSSAGSYASAGLSSEGRSMIVCGNGINEPGEQCDDGNRSNADGCDNTCRLVASPLCRNGVVDPGEQCDDGNSIDGDGCDRNCTLTPACGNRVVEYGERCDDGNRMNGDGCSANCQPENAPAVGSEIIDTPGTTPGTIPGGTNPDVTPIATGHAPAGNTGPAAVAVMAAGAASGWAWMRRKRR